MIFTDTPYPAGTIIVAAGNQPRYWEFTASMERLKVPHGTEYLVSRGCDVTQNFNGGLKKLTGDWVWFLGDDHSFTSDMLLRLLAHNKDVVIPPTPLKSIPFLPCMMHGDGTGEWKEAMPVYAWEELSQPGLMPLPYGDWIGQAGMLVKKSVFQDWPYPWFQCGQLDPGRLQEDMYFCRELQRRGHTIYVDCDQILDHHFIMGISARKVNGEWVPTLDNNGQIAVLPDMLATRTEDGQTKFRQHQIPITLGNQEIPAPPSRVKWKPTLV